MSGEIHKKFSVWLISQKLESFACCGLIILLKSLDKNDSASYQYLRTLKDAAELISVRCMGTELLLLTMSEKLQHHLNIQKEFIFALTEIKSGMNKVKFFKTIGFFLNGLYQRSFERIAAESRIDAWGIWYTFYIQKCAELGIEESREDKDYGRQRHNFIIGCSPIITDILKSAYFTTLDYLYHLNKISHVAHFHATIENFPIDLSLWRIKTFRAPSWWLSLKDVPSATKANIDITELDKPISTILDSVEGKKILYLAGTVISSQDHYDANVQASIQLLPFAYRVVGGNLPTPEEIFEGIMDGNELLYSISQKPTKFCFFDNDLSYRGMSIGDHEVTIKDLELTLLTAPISLFTGHGWQIFRLMSPFNLLVPSSFKDLKLSTESDHIEYRTDGKVIAEAFDFSLGIRDMSAFGNDIPHGTYLTIDKEYLSRFLDDKKMRLAYVYRIRYKTRGYSHSDEFEVVDIFDTINLSS